MTKISRANFLKIALLASAYTLIKGCKNSNQPDNTAKAQATKSSQTQVIVVGAGVAGLSAARKLQQQKYSVIVLEGRNRIGGRVWTDKTWQDAPIDMGASWIHGIKDNPIYDLAQKLKISTLPTDYDSISLYNSQGKLLTNKEKELIQNRYFKTIKQLNKLRQSMMDGEKKDISLQAAVERIIADADYSEQQLIELNHAINAEIEHEYGADIANLSSFYYDNGGEFGGEDVLFPGGYDQIIQAIAADLDIRLSQIVEKVSHNQQGVKITTNQGIFEAERAIITLPLGVLKKGSVEFSPPLPPRKQKAISNLGMGVLNKVYLRFPKVFWPRNTDLIGRISANKGEWAEWVNIFKYTGKPILLAFNAGKYGLEIEKFSEQEIVQQAMTALRSIYGENIPEPESWKIVKWAADTFAGGSYSYIPPGASEKDYSALAEPIANRLFFAGEATSRKYSASVHGAFLSGEREAKKIIAIRT